MPFDPGYYAGTTNSGSTKLDSVSPTAEQLRTFIDKEVATSDENVNRKKAADEFVAVYKHYGYIDNKANGDLMRHELQARGHWHSPTVTNFEEAFVALNESGLLTLDQKKLQAEQARLLDARAAEIRESTFSLEKAESMSMEELEKHARGWK